MRGLLCHEIAICDSSAMAVQQLNQCVHAVSQVSNHCLARPAREILYTVISTEEKYKAKVCIDTIIVRMGDSFGAGAFRLLDSLLGFGPAGLAATAVPVCLLWSSIAFRLGRKQQQLSEQRYFHH